MYPNYPNQGGYPNMPNQQFGFNQNPGYPQSGSIGFGDPMGGAPQYPGYPPSQSGYPGSQPGYPGSQPGYPSQPGASSGFPVYPNSQSGYPSSQPSYPGSQPGYPGSQPPFSGYPNQSGYPTQPPSGHLPDHIASNPNFQPSQHFGGSGQPGAYPGSSSSSNFFPNVIAPGSGPSYNQIQPRVFNPALRPYQPFNPSDDAAKLYKAMKGFGTDETTLIDILCRRTCQQRQEITIQYKTGYGKDLWKNIKDETKGNFELVFKALLYTPAQLEAHDLKKSIERAGTDEDALIDIVCTKTNSEMNDLKNAYKFLYNRNLEHDVSSDASGYFKRFLVSLIAAHRSDAPPDYQKAVQQARALYEAGEKRLGTNEVEFNRIFATESFPHLKLVFEEYYKLTGHDIDKAIKKEMSGDVERAFLAIAQMARNPAAYYANRLHETMACAGTKDRSLIRLMVLRSEIDMLDIKMEYQRRFGKTLESAIKNDCSGDYKRALLCLAGDPNWR